MTKTPNNQNPTISELIDRCRAAETVAKHANKMTTELLQRIEALEKKQRPPTA